MNRTEFVSAVVTGAVARGLEVVAARDGRQTICFNAKSGKKLHTDHLGELFDLGYADPSHDRRTLNALVERVAPGRPCTHRGLREIVEALHRQDAHRAG